MLYKVDNIFLDTWCGVPHSLVIFEAINSKELKKSGTWPHSFYSLIRIALSHISLWSFLTSSVILISSIFKPEPLR